MQQSNSTVAIGWIFKKHCVKLQSLIESRMQLEHRHIVDSIYYSCHCEALKSFLNWANICSPNILWTIQRTMICFLIELLVRRKWFGQFEEFTCSQLACNGMQASA